MNLTAVIAVRGGSTRVKNKNIRPFAGRSLLEIKISQLQKVNEINKIVVTSDSDQLLDLAYKNGAIPKRRPEKYCDEKSVPFNDVVKYITSEQVDTEYMIWTPCVCPLVSEKYIADGISRYKQQLSGELGGTGICTVTPFKEYLVNNNGPINYSIENFVKSQDLPDWYYIINGFFIARTAQMNEWSFIYGQDPLYYPIPKHDAIDIDDMTDFTIAESLYQGGYTRHRITVSFTAIGKKVAA